MTEVTYRIGELQVVDRSRVDDSGVPGRLVEGDSPSCSLLQDVLCFGPHLGHVYLRIWLLGLFKQYHLSVYAPTVAQVINKAG